MDCKVGRMADTEQRTSPHVAIDAAELRKLRHLLGDSQAKFAERCDMSPSYLSLIESGLRPTVSPAMYVRICEALGLEDRTRLMAGVQGQSA
jgi:transcriptional regulator with XRE-family HTH domain